MSKIRIGAVAIILFGALLAAFIYISETSASPAWAKWRFKYGLDLSGGTHLVYKADVSAVASGEVGDSMNALRDVIERRVNLFGVGEPVVQTEQTSALISGTSEQRLIVDLPGVTDVQQAIALIGATPTLDFRIQASSTATSTTATSTPIFPNSQNNPNMTFRATGLTGRYVTHASVTLSNLSQPQVQLVFNSDGAALFDKITKENVGKILAIYLDGQPISTPVIQEEIPSGTAIISGNFTTDEAKTLVGRLNAGALPVPIKLESTQTIGASLGAEATTLGVKAGIIGFLLVALFMIFWYRLPGLLSIVALTLYLLMMLSIFKLGVTLTAAGIAGLILSLGVAVDANVLIYERMKEERRAGKDLPAAIRDGFARAWLSIRDSHVSGIITSVVLFYFGTSLVQGFALTFGIGVLVSLISAITFTRTFMLAVAPTRLTNAAEFLYGMGFHWKLSSDEQHTTQSK